MKGFKHWFVPPVPPKGDFRVQGIGVRELMPPCIIKRPSGTKDYLFMFFYDPVLVDPDRPPRYVPPESFKAWEPAVPQHYGNPEKRWLHSWIHCDGAFVAQILKEARLPVNRAVKVNDPSVMEKNLLDLHEELTTHSPPDADIMRDLFRVMLRRLARAAGTAGSGARVPDRFMALKAHMEANFTQPMTLADLARRVHLSVPHLCSEFRRYFEVSPIELLIRLRMHAAAHHLSNVNRSISEVAELVGYPDLFYFSKLFKKRYGISPRAMRNDILARSPPPRRG